MTDTSAVLDQADALMRRHRSFVAQSPAYGPDPRSGEQSENDDFPVLTEIVSETSAEPLDLDSLLESLQQSIERELSVWLADTLPIAVASVSQHIIAELDTKLQHTLLPRLQSLIEAHRRQSS